MSHHEEPMSFLSHLLPGLLRWPRALTEHGVPLNWEQMRTFERGWLGPTPLRLTRSELAARLKDFEDREALDDRVTAQAALIAALMGEGATSERLTGLIPRETWGRHGQYLLPAAELGGWLPEAELILSNLDDLFDRSRSIKGCFCRLVEAHPGWLPEAVVAARFGPPDTRYPLWESPRLLTLWARQGGDWTRSLREDFGRNPDPFPYVLWCLNRLGDPVVEEPLRTSPYVEPDFRSQYAWQAWRTGRWAEVQPLLDHWWKQPHQDRRGAGAWLYRLSQGEVLPQDSDFDDQRDQAKALALFCLSRGQKLPETHFEGGKELTLLLHLLRLLQAAEPGGPIPDEAEWITSALLAGEDWRARDLRDLIDLTRSARPRTLQFLLEAEAGLNLEGLRRWGREHPLLVLQAAFKQPGPRGIFGEAVPQPPLLPLVLWGLPPLTLQLVLEGLALQGDAPLEQDEGLAGENALWAASSVAPPQTALLRAFDGEEDADETSAAQLPHLILSLPKGQASLDLAQYRFWPALARQMPRQESLVLSLGWALRLPESTGLLWETLTDFHPEQFSHPLLRAACRWRQDQALPPEEAELWPLLLLWAPNTNLPALPPEVLEHPDLSAWVRKESYKNFAAGQLWQQLSQSRGPTWTRFHLIANAHDAEALANLGALIAEPLTVPEWEALYQQSLWGPHHQEAEPKSLKELRRLCPPELQHLVFLKEAGLTPAPEPPGNGGTWFVRVFQPGTSAPPSGLLSREQAAALLPRLQLVLEDPQSGELVCRPAPPDQADLMALLEEKFRRKAFWVYSL